MYRWTLVIMALAVAGLTTGGETVVDTAESAAVTYPGFVQDMKLLGANLELVNDNDHKS